MACVLFTVLPMSGPLAGTLAVATKLAARGHRVVFIGIADCEEHVVPRGFEFVPVLTAWFPKGFIRESSERTWTLRAILSTIRQIRERLDALVDGRLAEVHEAIRKIRPDLFVIQCSNHDSALWGLVAHELGIPSVYLSTTVSPRADSWLPKVPPHTRFILPGTPFARWRTVSAWYGILGRDLLRRKLGNLLGLGLDPMTYIRALAKKAGYRKRIDTLTLLVCNLEIPELILFPRELDFPQPDRPDRYYLEPAVDVQRIEPPFAWERIDPEKPLLYCALGTLEYLRPAEKRRFFAQVIAMMVRRPDWQMVLAVGKDLPEEVPANVLALQKAPQIEILRRASAMITHAGANSTKEAIYFGVPMIAFPLGFDQRGNAARVVHHGLGLAGDAKRISSRDLEAMVTKVLEDPGFRARTREMGEVFRKLEESERSVQVLESFLADRPGSEQATRPQEIPPRGSTRGMEVR